MPGDDPQRRCPTHSPLPSRADSRYTARAMEDLVINDQLTLPAYELWYTASRAGGPGGQHVNTTSSRVTLHWCPQRSGVLTDEQKQRIGSKLASRINLEGVLQLHVDTHRSQLRNREEAGARLVELIREALHRPRTRKPTRPSRGSVERRLTEKAVASAKKKNRGPVSGD